MNERKHTVIIGGGITGLSAAYYLNKQSKDMDITLIEASAELGGKVKTVQRDGFTFERGPDSFLERKQSVQQLAKELGIDDELVRNATGQSYILSEDRLHPIPKGSVMGVPTEWGPFFSSSLFTLSGKLAAFKDLVTSKYDSNDDLSVGHFFRRRLGDQVVDRLIHPLISGIYSGDIDKLSLKATFPQFLDVEQKKGSLTKGLRPPKSAQPKSGKRKGQFLTFKNGLKTLIDALEKELEKETQILKETEVTHIEKSDDKYSIVIGGRDEKLVADHIIMTTPHHVTKKIFAQYDFIQDFLQEKNTSVANIVLAFEGDAMDQLPDGTGFVVSRKERYRITACTWTHKKWPHSTPDGHILIRAYVGKPGDEEILEKSDDEIEEIVLKDLQTILPIEKPPLFKTITRWHDAMPQYAVGHVDRLEVLDENMEKHLPGVYLAGNSYRGVGLPDCINQAKEAVNKIIEG